MAATSKAPEANPQAGRTRWRLTEELRITLFYLLVGTAWIVITDQVLGYLMGDPPVAVALQSVKGLAFVVASALLLWLALRYSLSQRREAEEALRLSHERFALAARAATDAIYDWDITTNRIWWSDSFHKLFGYRRPEIEPTLAFWTRQLHPEDREVTLKNLQEVVKGKRETWSQEYRFRRGNHTYAFVYDRGYVMRDQEGRPVRMIGGMSDISERKEADEKLEQSRRQLRALFARLQSLREEERSRISREIHDELGQLLTALKMDLRWLEKRIGERENDPSLIPFLEKAVEAGEVADTAITTVQKIASELRPGTLDNLGLAAALRHEAGKFQERTGINCQLRLPEDGLEVPRSVATAVFRIFQETMTNISRHAAANRVEVEVRPEGQSLVMEVTDDGKGISAEALGSSRSLGLLGMKERAVILGGEVEIKPAGAHGTRVTLRLPLTANDAQFWEHIQI